MTLQDTDSHDSTDTDSLENIETPIWYSPIHAEFEDTATYPGHEKDVAATLRRVLSLNAVAEAEDENIYRFGLSAFGAAFQDSVNEDGYADGVEPVQFLKSDHLFGIESTDLNVSGIGTNYPQIAADTGEGVLEDLPSGSDQWTTDLGDVQASDLDVGDDALPDILGGLSVTLGVAAVAAAPATAALLTGAGIGLSVASLVASVTADGETETSNEDKWKYSLTDTYALDSAKSIGVFWHSLNIYITVPHGESAKLRIYDSIAANETSHDFRPVYFDLRDFARENDWAQWDILIPRQDEKPVAPIIPAPHDRIVVSE